MSLRIGIDVDGILADFNYSYYLASIKVVGNKFGVGYDDIVIDTWSWPEKYGYTGAEVSQIWDAIMEDPNFWFSIRPYPTTLDDLAALSQRKRKHKDDIYFITARPGIQSKEQTEKWLMQALMLSNRLTGPILPTVLITKHKGLAARALDLHVYIDDKWENCLDVAADRQPAPVKGELGVPKCATFLATQPWNAGYDAEAHGLLRVSGIQEMLKSLEETAAGV